MAPLLEIEDVIENANLSVHQELNTIKSKAQLLEVLGSIPSQKSLDLQERIDSVMVNLDALVSEIVKREQHCLDCEKLCSSLQF